jgi:hypothetical protein
MQTGKQARMQLETVEENIGEGLSVIFHECVVDRSWAAVATMRALVRISMKSALSLAP